MTLPKIASTLALVTGLWMAAGCDSEEEIRGEIIGHGEDGEDGDADPAAASADKSRLDQLLACEWLGADRNCGEADDGVQFCAWLYNEETREVSTYWGECVQEAECTLWSCRAGDDALCDLVDGKPQWVADSCAW